MSTIYTVNGKVLKNADNGKWLTKKEGFVMDASNATITNSNAITYVRWQSPSYPDGYNGNGKQYILVNNNSEVSSGTQQLMYSTGNTVGGPNAISVSDMETLGTSTGVLLNNPAYPTYGACFDWPFVERTVEQVQAYLANVSITIVDP